MPLLASLKAASLLPSPIIPSTFTPSINLGVHFPDISPTEGSLARVSQVATQPRISVKWTNPAQEQDEEKGEEKYTFMLIDPDAPTPADPKFSYWRHWIVTNIPISISNSSTSPSSNTTQDIIPTGTTLTPYLAPGPKDDSGPHRYLFLLFREPAGFTLEKSEVGGDEFVDRRAFRAEEVVERKGLVLVGVQWMRGVGDGWVGEV